MNQGMNSGDVKRRNRGLCLKNIALEVANSRIELARQTGLTKMTTGNIVQEMLTKGIIEETDVVRSVAAGPNPQLLKIAATAPKIIGIYISRDALLVSVGDLTGKLFSIQKEVFGNETMETLTNKLFKSVESVLQGASSHQSKFLAIGVSIIGPIDKSGAVIASTNFFNIKSLPVKQLLSQWFSLPVIVYNDTSASAIAEQLVGIGKYNSFAYIGLANGISAGIINNGALLTSNQAFLGELGHTTIDYNGAQCACGNRGCLELYANIPVILDKLQKITREPVVPQDFTALAENPACDLVFYEVADRLTCAFINLVNLFKPQALIIGHEGYFVPDKYIAYMEKKLNTIKFWEDGSRIPIRKSCFKDNAAVYGSICCVLEEFFTGRLTL